VQIFSYDLCNFYARLNVMLFIAPFVNFSLSTFTPYSFFLVSSTSDRLDMILGLALIYVLDLILYRSLN
jgi:chromosome condensin MukBEF MukE localization factor